MKIRATLFSFATVAVVTTAAACGSSQNKVMADTPVLPYQSPDISEITGIDEDEDDVDDTEPDEAPSAAPAPAPAPAAAPAPAPAKAAPAKPAAKAQAPAPAKN